MINFQYSCYSTAIGLFNTLVNLIILLSGQPWFAKRYTKTGLFLEKGGEIVKLFQHARKTSQNPLWYFILNSRCLILLIVYPLWFVIIASFSNPSDVAAVGLVYRGMATRRLSAAWLNNLCFLRAISTPSSTVVGTIVALVINIPAGYLVAKGPLC